YEEGTLILETTFETETGIAKVIDFMPTTAAHSSVARMVVGLEGRVDFHMELIIRFGYGRVVPWLEKHGEGCYTAVAGPDMLVLRSTTPLISHDQHSHADFTVHAGQRKVFTLSHQPSHEHVAEDFDLGSALASTNYFWREFADRCPDVGPWTPLVKRSLITLKALTYLPTGGIVAAPTTSLPERLGGERNWDYRYGWIRDSTMTLYALLNAGYREEAAEWRRWLLRAVAGAPEQLHIMYGISGERWLPENEVPWLPGYEQSKPVRVGNLAVQQRQLDVYGEVMDVMHVAREADLSALDEAWRVQRALLEHLEQVWHERDQGIWEVRGPARAFTHSRVMCWAAFDRGVKSSEHFGLRGDTRRWAALRDTIFRDVLDNGYDARRRTFVQYYGGSPLDASLLMIPQLGFLPARDERIVGTVAAIERELVDDGFVVRYRPEEVDDGVGGREGAFLACSFWLADAYALHGRLDDATELFERLLDVRNDLGLLAEEDDPVAKRELGNLPQGCSDIGLVNTAFNLVDAHGPARQRAEAGDGGRREGEKGDSAR